MGSPGVGAAPGRPSQVPHASGWFDGRGDTLRSNRTAVMPGVYQPGPASFPQTPLPAGAHPAAFRHKRTNHVGILIAFAMVGGTAIIGLLCSAPHAGPVPREPSASRDQSLLFNLLTETERLSQQTNDGSAQDAGSEDVGEAPGTADASVSSIDASADPFDDPTTISIGWLLWTREPIKDPNTGKPKKYTSIQLAGAACSKRSTGWRLPKVSEFRMLTSPTKDGRIDDLHFPDFPIGAFWATPDSQVTISPIGVLDIYNGSAPPMVLCVKEDIFEEEAPDPAKF
jgi:hypothetical protein